MARTLTTNIPWRSAPRYLAVAAVAVAIAAVVLTRNLWLEPVRSWLAAAPASGDDHGHGHGAAADEHGHDDHDHDKAHKPKDGKSTNTGHDHDDDAHHSEVRATFTLECAAPEQITRIEFDYFKTFPAAQELDVQIVTPKGQYQYDVSRDKPAIDLAGLI